MMDNRRSLPRWVATGAICLVWVGAISFAATPGDPVLAVGCDLPSTADDGERARVQGLLQSAKQAEKLAALTVDYPLDGTIFPPDIIAPTFLWHDAAEKADAWMIEVRFGKDEGQAHVLVPGMPPPEGEVDPLAIASTNEVYQMTPYQASAVAWKPAAGLWAAIKRLSKERPTVVTVRGYAQGDPRRVLSEGRTTITTSSDPVGAPIFYRDVLLTPTTTTKNIQPVPKGSFPLIKWRLRDVSLPESRLMLTDMPTCANCHSFSADGATMGMDIDGPQGDKGAYALAPIDSPMVIENDEIITWNSFTAKPPGHKTLGFLSRVSPSGRYVVSTLNEDIYVRNFTNYKFVQVFYPTRGILGYYDRLTSEMKPLPGADDPEFVHNGGVWTPDGKSLVFSRATAMDAYQPDQPLAKYAGDPNELQIKFDLYRIPFNEGRGGTATPLLGASANGMSNTFPKVSPDGKWLVFVKSKNGMLMRPDGRLWMIPAEGGEAREMNCNTSLMNSWHSFSPNGRWLVFSTKVNSPYTQMMLTHIDEKGNDSPPVLIENSTAANRAVNLPEFVNIPYEDFAGIDVPAVEVYRHYRRGNELATLGRDREAVLSYEAALKEVGDSRIHDALARTLIRLGQMDKALEHIRASLELKPYNFETHLNMGYILSARGEYEQALEHMDWAVRIHARHPQGWYNRATIKLNLGKTEEALADYSEALELMPRYPEALNGRGVVRIELGDLKGALADFDRSIEIHPDQLKPWYFRALVRKDLGDLPGALADVEHALELAPPGSPRRPAIETLERQIRAQIGG